MSGTNCSDSSAESANLGELLVWVAAEEMSTDSYEGWCWIVYKGRVVEAYRDHDYRYMFGRMSSNVYMRESISHVMKWPYPEPPH